MKRTTIGILLVLMLFTVSVNAQTINGNSITWDFSDGLQGWNLSGPGNWIDPNSLPNGPWLPDGGVSGGGAQNLYLPDGSYARIDISEYLVGGRTDTFILQADVYVPNLRPLSGFTHGYPGNMFHNAGIAAWLSHTNYGVSMFGNINSGAITYKDQTSGNWSDKNKAWIIEQNGDSSTWWDNWITLKIDYNYTVAGQVTASAYVPWSGPVHTAGWNTVYVGSTTDNIWTAQNFNILQIGNRPRDGSSWTQSQFDNVSFYSPDLIGTAAVPEPGNLLAMGTGLVALCGVVLRKKRIL